MRFTGIFCARKDQKPPILRFTGAYFSRKEHPEARELLLRRFFVIFACMMKIVVAPDSYKECLTASEVAEAIAAGLEEAGVVIGNGKEKAKGVTGNVADEVRKPVEDGVEVVRMPVAVFI